MPTLWERVGARIWTSGGMPAAWCLLAVGLAAIVFIPRQDPTVGRSACRATASVSENSAQPPFSVTCFDNDPSRAARSADALAEQYVAARQADLRRQADAQYADAHARTEKARRDEDQFHGAVVGGETASQPSRAPGRRFWNRL